ncbi:MAG TPA: hypothetical protein DCE41_22685 [Cytophagales bacterium]|nr:hypothetical protein [Cytophagales bacterium]
MIFIIIGLLLAGFLGLGLYNARQLQQIHITKSVTISAPMDQVFNQVKYLNNFPKWSPFLEEDPTQTVSVKGTDGTVGAQYHWEGRNGKDLGYQEIKQIVEDQYIKMRCEIQKPFQAQPVFEYSFSQTAQGVTVQQDFDLKSGLVDAFFMWLFGAAKGMDKTNARGMELLQTSLEG